MKLRAAYTGPSRQGSSPEERSLAKAIADCLGPNRTPLAYALGLVAFLGAVAPLQGATFTVTNTNDSGAGSLRQAISEAVTNPGDDEVVFDSTVSGTIVLTSGPLNATNFYDDGSLAIIGPGKDSLTIDGNGGSSVLFGGGSFLDGSIFNLSGFTLKNADRGLNLYTSYGSATVEDCVITGTSESGLVVTSIGDADVLIQSVDISGNAGTGLWQQDGYGLAVISGSTITDNGGLGIWSTSTNRTGPWVAVEDSVIARNAMGGFVAHSCSTGLSVSDTQVVDNGGVGIQGIGFSVDRAIVSGNTGGGAAATLLSMKDSTVSNNMGPGITMGSGTCSDSILGFGRLHLLNSTISGNESQTEGGGILQANGSMVILNSTITGNKAEIGGGIFKTFLWEDWGYSPYLPANEITTIANTIVAANEASINPDLRIGAESIWDYVLPAAVSYTLIGDPGDAYISESIPGSNLFGEDPLLEPLQDNGGPTLTHALRSGSPAIDRGNPEFLPPPGYDCGWMLSADSCALLPPDWDQRSEGFDRIRNGRVDMGAFELQEGSVPKGGAWLRSLSDIDGNGSPEVAVIKRDAVGRDLVTVKDAASGALVSQFDGSYTGRLVDVEIGWGFGPGSGAVPSLVLLGATGGTVRANTRDVLTGEWFESVDFDFRFRPVDLTVLPDQTGDGAPELGLLGTAISTKVEIRDATTGALVNNLWFPEGFTPLQVLSLPDVNGNSSAEVGVVLTKGDEADRVVIKDTFTTKWIRMIKPAWRYRAFGLLQAEVVEDRNGNGVPEVAMLLRDPNTGETVVWVADAATNKGLARVTGFHKRFVPTKLVALSDLTGDRIEDYGLLGRDPETTQVMVEVRNGRNSALVKRIWFNKDCTPLDMVSIADINANGADELVMLGRCGTARSLRAFIKDAKTAVLLNRLYF